MRLPRPCFELGSTRNSAIDSAYNSTVHCKTFFTGRLQKGTALLPVIFTLMLTLI